MLSQRNGVSIPTDVGGSASGDWRIGVISAEWSEHSDKKIGQALKPLARGGVISAEWSEHSDVFVGVIVVFISPGVISAEWSEHSDDSLEREVADGCTGVISAEWSEHSDAANSDA